MNSNKPFFSVVIPLYNKQNYVKETIESALAQTFQDFEIVVVNDGSTDESVKVIEAIGDDRIRLIHQENAGVSVARNRGIQEAHTDYIAFLDADDLWLPEFLQTIYELVQKYPNAGLYGTAYRIQSNGTSRPLRIIGLPTYPFRGYLQNYFKARALGGNLVWTSAVCIPKMIFFGRNIWFPAGVKYGEDQYVWGRIALEEEIAYDTRECAIYIYDAENNTTDVTSNFLSPQDSRMRLRNYRHLAHNKEIAKWLDRYLEKYLLSILIRNKERGFTINAVKVLMSNKFSVRNFIFASAITLIPFPLFVLARKIRRSP